MGDLGIWLDDLRISAGETTLVQNMSLALKPGEVLGLVGQSGSGKTLSALALLGLVDLRPGVVSADYEIRTPEGIFKPYEGCLGAGRRRRGRAFAAVRGELLSYLPQHPRSALDPLLTVGRAVAGAARLGPGDSSPIGWLERAGMRDAARVATLYPHELSGGMAQRVVIAQSLARGSQYLIADEPTTGLDPGIQEEILDGFRSLRDKGLGILLITHDLRILPGLADSIAIMHKGSVAETTSAVALGAGEVQSEAARRLVQATRRIAGGGLG